MNIETGLNLYHDNEDAIQSKRHFARLIQSEQYVGELYSINYESARVLVHDHERQSVGGIPRQRIGNIRRGSVSTKNLWYRNKPSRMVI